MHSGRSGASVVVTDFCKNACLIPYSTQQLKHDGTCGKKEREWKEQ